MDLRKYMCITVAVLTLLAACKDGPSGDGGTELGGDGSTTGDGDGDDDSTGDGDGESDCEPEGDAIAAFQLQNFDEDQEIDWDLSCTLDSVGPPDGGPGYVISLIDCASQNGGDDQGLVELFVLSNPDTAPLPLAQPGDGFRLRYVGTPPFIAGRWFTLRNDPGGTLLLAGLYGPEVLPSNVNDFNYAPLDIELVNIGCASFEHPSQCGNAVRMGLLVTFGDDVATISDKNYGYVGQLASYQIFAHQLLDFPQVTCDDFPGRILAALFFSIPEG